MRRKEPRFKGHTGLSRFPKVTIRLKLRRTLEAVMESSSTLNVSISPTPLACADEMIE